MKSEYAEVIAEEEKATPKPEEKEQATPEPKKEATPKVELTPEQQRIKKLEKDNTRLLDTRYKERMAKEAALAKVSEFEQRLQTLESGKKPSQDGGKPKMEDFETQEDYYEAIADWKVDQKLADQTRKTKEQEVQTTQQKILHNFELKCEQAREKYEDWDELNPTGDHILYNEIMANFTMTSDYAGDIAHYLAENPTEAERISKLSPAQATREMVAIEDKFVPAKAKTTIVPPPINPLKEGNLPDKAFDWEKGDQREAELRLRGIRR